MNKFFLFFSIFFFNIIQAQDFKIKFTYDSAGNQTKRELKLGGANRPTKNEAKEISELVEEDLQKFFPEDVISYYPNPVREELFLKWELIDENKVSTIAVYTTSGQLMKSYKQLETKQNQIIPFQELPEGIYSIILYYTNGEEKFIKIIKK